MLDRKTLDRLAGLVPALTVAALLAGCGDPVAQVSIRNETARDYILAWVEAGTKGDSTYTDSVLLPAGSEGSAYQRSGPAITDWTFLLLTPTCDIASALRASGADINLVVTAQQGWLDRVDDPIGGVELQRSTECISL
jgi:hypothetical protein